MVTENNPGTHRARILAYVEQRIGDRGIAGFSVDEIMTALGMSKKTFYKVFPSRDAMLEELVTRIVEGVGAKIDAVVGSDRAFPEKIQGLMGVLSSVYGKLAVPLSEELYRTTPSVWNRVEEFRHRKIQAVFSALLDQGIAEGQIDPGVHRTVFLASFLAAARAVITPRFLAEHPISAVEAVRQMLGIFFGGIMTDAGRRALADLRSHEYPHSS